MHIPFLDLKKINQRHQSDFQKKWMTFFENHQCILGDEVSKFEEEYATYCQTKHCVGVGNGYDALFLMLRGYQEIGMLQKGDHILVAANTYFATVLAIENAGFTPVFIDPDPKTYNLDANTLHLKLKADIQKKIKSILVTHLYGQLAPMYELQKLCEKNNVILLADAAQAHGASTKKGDRAGCLADAAAFSFYPSKNLGALGDAGAITTNNTLLFKCLQKLRNYGAIQKNQHEYLGVNTRLDELQAAFLRVKLPFLDSDNSIRRTIAQRYCTEITNPHIVLPKWSSYKDHVFHLFIIRVKNPKNFRTFLQSKGVETGVHYPTPVHKQKAFTKYATTKCSISEHIAQEIVSLPISPVLTNNEVSSIIDSINSYQNYG